jgi:hypothetical protein
MYSSPSTNLFQLFRAFRWLVFATRDFAGSLEDSLEEFGWKLQCFADLMV